MSLTIEDLQDRRDAYRVRLIEILSQAKTPVDFGAFRRVTCETLREYKSRYGELPGAIRHLACEKLYLSDEALTVALNHEEILTRGLVEAGKFTPASQILLRALHRRPEGLQRSRMIRLYGKQLGNKDGVDAALAPLLAEQIVVAVKHHAARGGPSTWYELVRV